MPISADALVDTSTAVALLSRDHPHHSEVKRACRGDVLGLAGHALFETYSVLTRLPGPARLSHAAAQTAIERAFPASAALPESAALDAVATLVRAGIAGGSVYDGLVGLAAKAAGIPLLSCDRRALSTYAALGVDVRLI
ncbi:type II toxin-antitoxin system VapC family toxin [Microbacterium resistens]|uniref:type II toxin-antitoxin system VapC family toxin n=1 Tax=Microbacterium resistens TaxID=156977 RepID=UPI001C5631B0|nr:type II toxin-antitoxin system VapC family toxin [Microbacterium resistens]MBW1639776.1 type II toxin-antitoxin system VapC family toxin [Microbacterium resistens]